MNYESHYFFKGFIDNKPLLSSLWSLLAKSRRPPRFLQVSILNFHVQWPSCNALAYIHKTVFCFHQRCVKCSTFNTGGTYPFTEAIMPLVYKENLFLPVVFAAAQ